MHDVKIGGNGSLRTTASLTVGRDWTWTLANDADSAVSLDPSRRFVAIPFTSFTELDRQYSTGAHVVELTSAGVRTLQTLPSNQWVERLLFFDGRLVGFGPDGVNVLEYGRPASPDRLRSESARVR
jgi:hypothetical protein